MYSMTPSELAALNQVAHDLRQDFEARGHHIDEALETDSAFDSGRSRSSLARDLASQSVKASVSRSGRLQFDSVQGGGLEIRSVLSGVDRRFRLKKARFNADGEAIVSASSDSALAVDDFTLFRHEPWVLGWTLTDSSLVGHVFAGQILRYEEGRPGRLILGPVARLVGIPSDRSGFEPYDEGLDGFDDDELDDVIGNVS